MKQIFWACVIMLASEPYYVMGTMYTKAECENVAARYEPPSIQHSSIECYPVNVTDHDDIIKQIKALKIITNNSRDHQNKNQ